MIKDEELRIAFYKNGGAENVLERFEFTQEEEKLIRDAIRTAKMPNPRMKLIDKVDEFLEDVAKHREPISSIEEGNSSEVLEEFEKVIIKDKVKKIEKKYIGNWLYKSVSDDLNMMISLVILILMIITKIVLQD